MIGIVNRETGKNKAGKFNTQLKVLFAVCCHSFDVSHLIKRRYGDVC